MATTRWQKVRSWLKQNAANVVLPGLTVLVTAVAGTFAALYAHGQIQAANEQKVVAQQQELLILVVDIEQEPAAETRATAHLSGGLLTNVQVQFQDELTSYAQAAQLIIGGMPGKDVSGFAYVQVGKALAASGNNFQALSDFQAAAKPSNTPDTRAAALRNAARVNYALGQDGLGHQEELAAVHAFARHPDLTTTDTDNNVAQSYLVDASYQIALGDCQTALADQQDARQALRNLPDHRHNEATENRDLTTEDQASYRKRCQG
jgi:hypothetical protein